MFYQVIVIPPIRDPAIHKCAERLQLDIFKCVYRPHCVKPDSREFPKHRSKPVMYIVLLPVIVLLYHLAIYLNQRINIAADVQKHIYVSA